MKLARKKRLLKTRLSSRKKRDYLFVAILLAYPVLQFAITWIFINFGALKIAFERTDIFGNTEFVWFEQFKIVIKDMFETTANDTGVPWLNNSLVIVFNSLGYAAITIFISLPLSLLFSYFLQKNMPLANVFRVIFFLPNIIPIVALVMAYNMPLDGTYGYMHGFMKAIGFGDYIYGKWPTSQLFVYVYCIWAGLGYNVVLMSGAIGRIPKEIYESAQLDGAGYFREFTQITIPLIWPTVVTLIVLGLTNVLTLYLQPYLLTNGDGLTYSLAMEIFMNTAEFNPIKYSQMAAKGLLFSVIWAPIVLLIRNRLSKKFSGVDF